jgi:hypothetical protein
MGAAMGKTIASLFLVLALLTTLAVICQAQTGSGSQTDPYAVELPAMTVAQCGQCHPTYFRTIRDEGGRHRFACMDCHERFHAYNPAKNNWAELMPRCDQCHQQPHGDKLTNCLQCHADPHAPLAVAMDDTLVAACTDCHREPTGQLVEFPSKHTKLNCSQCHSSHGLIPSCLECHTPHVDKQPVSTCMACHPVHKPMQISYDATAGHNATCGSCHTGVFQTWQATRSLHGTVNCGQCHASHGQIPTCASCHGQPHGAGMLQKFPDCLSCHVDAHDLPTKQ